MNSPPSTARSSSTRSGRNGLAYPNRETPCSNVLCAEVIKDIEPPYPFPHPRSPLPPRRTRDPDPFSPFVLLSGNPPLPPKSIGPPDKANKHRQDKRFLSAFIGVHRRLNSLS